MFDHVLDCGLLSVVIGHRAQTMLFSGIDHREKKRAGGLLGVRG